MPKRSRRKSKGPRPSVAAVIWSLLLANVAMGYFYSPITSPTKIRVIGAPPEDRLRIEGYLDDLVDVPFSAISVRKVESDVLANPVVANCDLSLNPFGRGILKLELRHPVARFANTRNVVLGNDGVAFRSSVADENLPVLALPEEASSPNLSFFAPWEPAEVAWMCERFSAELPQGKWQIVIDQKGAICFNRTGSGRILLGDTNALDEKLLTLRKILAEKPQFLEGVEELNLTAPSNPKMVPRSSK